MRLGIASAKWHCHQTSKKWLGLTKSTTAAVLLIFPAFSLIFPSKQSWTICQLLHSHKTHLDSFLTCISNPCYWFYSKELENTLQIAINSVESINRKTLPRAVSSIIKAKSAECWDHHLNQLTVQKKFGEVCELKKENRVCNHIREGLSMGQLSFILRAASFTLPTPNYIQWLSCCPITPGGMTVSYWRLQLAWWNCFNPALKSTAILMGPLATVPSSQSDKHNSKTRHGNSWEF